MKNAIFDERHESTRSSTNSRDPQRATKRLLKTKTKEKQLVMNKGSSIQISTNFSAEILQEKGNG